MPQVSPVLAQHAESTAFLWQTRAHAVSAPHYNLADLAKLDQRVEANLDGLRVAGDAGWEICKDALIEGEGGEVFAAAALAFESGQPDRVAVVLNIGATSQELSRGFVSALGWLTYQQAEPHIQTLLASPSTSWQRIGMAASAIHRQNPGRALDDARASTDPLLRARALRTMGELGIKGDSYEMEKRLSDPDALCRFWAAWSRALLSRNLDADSKALAVLVSAAESDQPYREKALQLALRRMETAAATTWQEKLAQDPEQLRTAIVAAGALGNAAAIPWLIGQMKTPELARVAGEAFTTISGVDIAYQDLDRRQPEDFSAGPTEDPQDDDVEMDADENLPWPAPEKIAKWWDRHRGNFEAGRRYLLGEPISAEWCGKILRNARQCQRAAAALELAAIQPEDPLFNVAAPGFRQQRQLGLRR